MQRHLLMKCYCQQKCIVVVRFHCIIRDGYCIKHNKLSIRLLFILHTCSVIVHSSPRAIVPCDIALFTSLCISSFLIIRIINTASQLFLSCHCPLPYILCGIIAIVGCAVVVYFRMTIDGQLHHLYHSAQGKGHINNKTPPFTRRKFSFVFIIMHHFFGQRCSIHTRVW